MNSKPLHRWLCLATFLSGSASLTYQVVWQRVLTQEVGIDGVSMAIIVSIFLAGLGIGSRAGDWAVRKFHRRLLLCYAVLELGTGLYGLVGTKLLKAVNSVVLASGVDHPLVDLVANFAVILPPCLLMGMTLPVVLGIVVGSGERMGTKTGIFYGINILGAALGTLVSAFLSIETIGLSGTAQAAAGLNILLGVVTLAFAKRSSSSSVVRPPLTPKLPLDSVTLGACVLLGFVSLAYEVLLFRMISSLLGAYVYVFPLMLFFYLLFMGVANFVTGVLLEKVKQRNLPLIMLAALVGTSALTVFSFRFPMLWHLSITPANWVKIALFLIPPMLLPLIPLCSLFPIVVRVSEKGNQEQHHVGSILFFYTIGNVFGCLVTAQILLPQWGTFITTKVCLLLLVVAVLLLLNRESGGQHLKKIALGAVASLTLSFLIPLSFYQHYGGYDITEDEVGVVKFYNHEVEGSVRINTASAARVVRNTSHLDYSDHNFSSLLVFDREFVPEEALVIGLGDGTQVWGLVHHPFVKRVTVIELSQGVADMVMKYSAPEIVSALRSPKVRLIRSDGRRFVQRELALKKKYNLVQMGTFFPDAPGSANLYSIDFFRQIKNLLAQGGYFVTLDCTGSSAMARRIFSQGFMFESIPLYAFFSDHRIKEGQHRRLPSWLSAAYTAKRVADQGLFSPSTPLPRMEVRWIKESVIHSIPLNSDEFPHFEYSLLQRTRGSFPVIRERLFQTGQRFMESDWLEIEHDV